MLFHRVENKYRFRCLLHRTETTEVALQLGEFAVKKQRLFLNHEIELADFFLALKFEHLVDAQRNGAEVREHSAEPTLVDIRHSTTICGLANWVLGLLLRSDEEHVAAVGHEVTKEVVGRLDAIQRLVEINDVNAVALTEDEAAHFGVPASGLVAEVRTCLNHLTHADESHESLLCGLRLGSRQGAETTADDGNMSYLE